MKRRPKLVMLLLFILAVSVSINSCVKAPTILFEDDLTAFKLTTHASVHKEGAVIYEFDEQRHQIVYTQDKRMYMVTNMEQTEFYSLTTQTTPRLFVTINVKLKSVGIEALKPAIYTMVMVQQRDNKIWLWDDKTHIGFVLDIL